jgi:hypothetical protein
LTNITTCLYCFFGVITNLFEELEHFVSLSFFVSCQLSVVSCQLSIVNDIDH